MDIKYLRENNLMEAHRQFSRLAEAYMIPEEELYEEGEEEQQADPNAMGGDPNGGMPPGEDPNAMGGDPNGGMPPGGDPNAMNGDPNGEDPNAMGGDPNAMGGDPNAMGGGMPPQDPPMDTPIDDQMGGETEDDNTIDIDDLTRAQEKLDVKQNHVGQDLGIVDNKLNKLIDTIGKLENMIDSQNSEIERFKQEFEKRNPTQDEKMDLRSLAYSAPFNVKPTNYWENKTKDSNYTAYESADDDSAGKYNVTTDDVNNYDSDIANSFYKIDDDDIQTIDKIFKY